jgi:hypothetical protein
MGTSHHEKSIFSCLQVTSKSTKAPLYTAMSLVYKRQLIFHGGSVGKPGKMLIISTLYEQNSKSQAIFTMHTHISQRLHRDMDSSTFHLSQLQGSESKSSITSWLAGLFLEPLATIRLAPHTEVRLFGRAVEAP